MNQITTSVPVSSNRAPRLLSWLLSFFLHLFLVCILIFYKCCSVAPGTTVGRFGAPTGAFAAGSITISVADVISISNSCQRPDSYMAVICTWISHFPGAQWLCARNGLDLWNFDYVSIKSACFTKNLLFNQAILVSASSVWSDWD